MLRLTNSAFDLGLVSAFQFVPTLTLGLFGGVLADRFDKRRVLIFTQAAFGVFAAVLAVLTATGLVRLWQVYVLALCTGIVTVLDAPTRQAFVVDMVGPEDLANAIALNSSVFNSARAIGPAVAGALIASVGLATCFYLNAISYVAVIGGLMLMRPEELRRAQRRAQAMLPALREGLQYIRSRRLIILILVLIAVIGTFGMNMQVLIPVLASSGLKVGAVGFGILSSASGVGALIGALAVASTGRATLRMILIGAIAFGVFQIALALPVGYAGAIALLFVMGGSSIVYTSASNSLLQLNVADEVRGRVMSVYFLLFAGTTPIGAPIIGAVATKWGVTGGFLVEGAITLLAAGYGLWAAPRALPQAAEMDPH